MIDGSVEGDYNLFTPFEVQRVVEMPDGLDSRDESLAGIIELSVGIEVGIRSLRIVRGSHTKTQLMDGDGQLPVIVKNDVFVVIVGSRAIVLLTATLIKFLDDKAATT